jgi:hypothetical protein
MKFAHRAALALLGFAIAGGGTAAFAEPEQEPEPHGAGNYLAAVPDSTQAQLKEAKHATEKFRDVAVAVADGYVPGPYVSGEGFHYLNQKLLDCTFDPKHPEVLLYAFLPGETELRLVALEYAIPVPCQPPGVPPEGFFGDADVWNTDEGEPLWLVTVWLYHRNPHGVFTQLNPRVP